MCFKNRLSACHNNPTPSRYHASLRVDTRRATTPTKKKNRPTHSSAQPFRSLWQVSSKTHKQACNKQEQHTAVSGYLGSDVVLLLPFVPLPPCAGLPEEQKTSNCCIRRDRNKLTLVSATLCTKDAATQNMGSGCGTSFRTGPAEEVSQHTRHGSTADSAPDDSTAGSQSVEKKNVTKKTNDTGTHKGQTRKSFAKDRSCSSANLN